MKVINEIRVQALLSIFFFLIGALFLIQTFNTSSLPLPLPLSVLVMNEGADEQLRQQNFMFFRLGGTSFILGAALFINVIRIRQHPDKLR
jgi:hypothetical protein